MTSETTKSANSKRPANRVLAAIMAERWHITRGGMERILQIAMREPRLEEMEELDLDFGERSAVNDRVATIPVEGPIFQKANLFTEMSGATSSQMLARDIQAADARDDVDAIVLNVNSPGGQQYGLAEVVDAVKESGKPVTAYVSGMAASAAYWIASAADEIVMSRESEAGSIGSVLGVYKDDDDVIEIVSEQSPYKRLKPEDEDNMKAWQEEVNASAELFINEVAQNRRVSVDTVKSDFGRGGMFLADKAVSVGMADRIGSYESAIRAARVKGAEDKAKGDMALALHNLRRRYLHE